VAKRENENRQYASPPCLMHEIEPGYSGLPVSDPKQQELDVSRWRKAERSRQIASRLALPSEQRRVHGKRIAGHLKKLIGDAAEQVVSAYWPFRGLDSLIGVLDLLKGGRRPLLVSHYWDAETSKAQSYLLDRLQRRFPSPEIRSMRVRLGFDHNHLDTGEVEETQRGRSFLFFALASLAASAFRKPTKVNVPENGLIALNVPLDPLRFGALSTRTAHPYFIAGMNRLLREIGIEATLVNEYRHRTKGEMVKSCADRDFLKKEVGNSMSCSSPAKARYKKLSPRHCGYCVPCLIRRASLKEGLGAPDPTLYTVPDLTAQTLFTDKSEGENVRSFQLMARRLEERPELAGILVHKPGPLTNAPTEIGAYADVFRRGVLEVAELLGGVTAKPS